MDLYHHQFFCFYFCVDIVHEGFSYAVVPFSEKNVFPFERVITCLKEVAGKPEYIAGQ